MSHSASGLLLLVIAGIMNASFTLPMKLTRNWAWENTWSLWSAVALLALPATMALATVPGLAEIYRLASPGQLFSIVMYGAGWGISQIFFGIAADQIGIALTFSLVLGTSAAVGSAIPMLRLNPGKLQTSGGYMLLGGIATVLLGVALCAVAGTMRERIVARAVPLKRKKTTGGLILAILCGCGAALLNVGFAFGANLRALATYHGATAMSANNAIWLPLLGAGAIPNLLYCLYLLRRNSTGRNFYGAGGANWILALAMGILWFGSVLLYGMAASRLGPLGASVGWSLFMSIIIIAASLLGIMTGEWKQSGRWPLATQFMGVGTLIISIFVLGAASLH